ncbi:MAG: aldo/keto reductase [Albidovulum sp.]|nr:aldo/keto reductase [Albidovulum sp.]
MNICFQKSFQRAFGTFPLRGRKLMAAIEEAIDVGYRAFDTAQMYGNESETGESLAAAGLPREEICVTTKVDAGNFTEGKFLASVEKSLKKLRLDSVDVLLLHWPPPNGDVAPSIKLLADAHKKGLARNVGVSNYTIQMMREAVAVADVPIVTKQVEFHALLNQEKLLAGSIETGIPLSSYCSMARGKVLDRTEFAEIGQSYGKSASQIALRWIIQKGVSINTMSTNPANIRRNFEIMDFTLSAIDMARIDRISKSNYRIASNMGADWDFD